MTNSTDPRLQPLRDAVMEHRKAEKKLRKIKNALLPVGSWVKICGRRTEVVGQIISHTGECVRLLMKNGDKPFRHLAELEPCEPPAWAERKEAASAE